jgi:nucleotide-binding universal stress UspA family protein
LFKKILIPVDGSVSAEKLITWTGTLAGRIGAEVVLLAVADPVEWIPWPAAAAWNEGDSEDGIAAGIDPYPEGGPQRHSMSDFAEKAMERALENARAYLGQRADLLRISGRKPTVEVREGSPSLVIPEMTGETSADLVVMSSRRTSALARGVLGSVTDRIIRSSAVPVMVAHPDYIDRVAAHDGAIESVIVPLDGSALSEVAAGPAIALAGKLGARMVFMRCLESGRMRDEPDIQAQDEAAAYLGQFVETAQSEGSQANSRIVSGSAAAQILAESEAQPGSIVAMGTHGRGGFRRFFLGSVTDKVVRSSNVPVMVVPPGAGTQ